MFTDDPSIIKPVFERVKAAFATGKTLDLDWREQQLKNFIKGYEQMTDKFNEALKDDLGQNEFYASFLAHNGNLALFKHTLENLRKWNEVKEVSTPANLQPGKSYLVQEPFGVVLVIGPWNYPFNCTLPYVASAIAAGNCCVVKPSELAPRSSHAIAELFEKFMDKECFAVIEGEVKVASEICTYPWDHIVFTGGTEKGKKVAMAAAANLVPCTLELGGKCPAIVDRDAEIDIIAKRLVHTRMFNWGQTCVSPDYILAHKDIKEKLLEKLKEAFLKFYGADAFQSKDRTKIISVGHVKRIESYLKENHGGKVFYTSGDGKCNYEERYVPPTIIDSPRVDSLVMTEEIFGPILSVQGFGDIGEAIKFVNARPKPLALYYFGEANKEKVIKHTSSGGITINDACFHIFTTELPFGGVGFSGTGTLNGEFGFKTLSHLKPVLERGIIDTPQENQRYPPYQK